MAWTVSVAVAGATAPPPEIVAVLVSVSGGPEGISTWIEKLAHGTPGGTGWEPPSMVGGVLKSTVQVMGAPALTSSTVGHPGPTRLP